jgi:phosphate transport system permease protein
MTTASDIAAASGITDTMGVRKYGTERSVAVRNTKERIIFGFLVLCGFTTISITLLILYILLSETLRFFKPGIQDVAGNTHDIGVFDFIFGVQWNPLLGDVKHFGIWPLITGTLQVTFVAMMVAIPLGLVVAIWLSEYAKPKVRSVVKPVLEVLAGIPTVVFGFFALTFVTPLLKWDFQGMTGDPNPSAPNPLGVEAFNVWSAGLTVGIMCIPIVTSLSEDALRAVPRALREGSYGLGASRFETSIKVVLPAALSGVIAAFLLAIARAVGETMIVALAAGQTPPQLHNGITRAFAFSDSTQTMTGYMVQIFFGEVSAGSVEYQSIYAVGFTLFVLTLVITLLGAIIRNKFRQAYE